MHTGTGSPLPYRHRDWARRFHASFSVLDAPQTVWPRARCRRTAKQSRARCMASLIPRRVRLLRAACFLASSLAPRAGGLNQHVCGAMRRGNRHRAAPSRAAPAPTGDHSNRAARPQRYGRSAARRACVRACAQRSTDKPDAKETPKERPDKPMQAAAPPPPAPVPAHGRPASTDRVRQGHDGGVARRAGAGGAGRAAAGPSPAEAELADVRRELEARRSELREKDYVLQVRRAEAAPPALPPARQGLNASRSEGPVVFRMHVAIFTFAAAS
jgi:hypothetical protein